MRELLKNWKVLFLIIVMLFAVLIIFVNGLKFGLDFSGGTQFLIHLSKPVNPDELALITSVVSKRLDWTGLKDTKVSTFGSDFILVQVAESDPKNVERIELLLKKQGKFEATLDGNILFTGTELKQIFKDPQKGYGFMPEGDAYKWTLPFLLSDAGARSFTEKTFHKCTIGFDPQTNQKTYDCEKTYFFIDRPLDSVIVLSIDQFNYDKELYLKGNRLASIPEKTKIDELKKNASVPFIVFDQNLSAEQKEELLSLLELHPNALVPSTVDLKIIDDLNSIGFNVKKIEPEKDIPWTWTAAGAKEVISLSEDVTNLNPYKERIEDATVYSELLIRGYGADQKDAMQRLSDLTIILESGSLPISVESISRETVSATLGREFLNTALIMGLVSLLIVALVLYVRYRQLSLTLPMMMTAVCEVVLTLGFASLIKWNLDLASIAGILTVVGTGVNDQIVITDELLKKETETETSFVNRIKRAFFIIFTAAATVIATMLPLIIFSSGMGKLVGFAITTIVGLLAGVIVTRPAYSEIAKYLLSHKK